MTPPSRDEAGYHAAFLTAPLRLLDALAQQQPLPPVVFVSSTAVYGADNAQPDEQSEPSPDAFNGRILLARSEEHTSELQSRPHLVCRLLLEKKKKKKKKQKLV